MTLSRQMMILVVMLVMVLFAGTLAISVLNTRDYLETQLASHAQDAASSLGLSATAHVERDDQAMVAAMVNAMFHRGDYLRIRFEDLQGKAWIERVAELRVNGVPAWFMRVFALEPPQRSATMMAGWRQVGQVLVTSHPGLAYRQLWQTSVQTLNLFLVVAVLALLGGMVALRILLRPLKAVESQAQAISNREFPVVEARPFTLEFRRVVQAMNTLSSKVQRMLGDAERSAAILRHQAFQDPVTGLANRRQFMDVLTHRVSDPEQFAAGGLMLLQLRHLKAFNQARGYPAGDHLLAETARALLAALQDEAGATLAHLSGADFAVLLDSASGQRLRELAERAVGAVAALYGTLQLPSPDVAHLGAVSYAGQTASELLAEADMALREAQRDGANAYVVSGRGVAPVAARSASEWRTLIEQALHRQCFTLRRQAVVGCAAGELLHHEVFLRIPDPERPDEQIAAAVFMPMAEGAGITALVERAVTERVIAELESGDCPGRVAVNLAAPSLNDEDLLQWFQDKLEAHPAAAARLILELPEYGAMAHARRLMTWIERLRPFGVEFSLDHFGRGFASFAYLRSLKADYLKVDGSFVQNLRQQDANRFFLRALADIAHGLEMRVIAESVETEDDWLVLSELGVDGGRGYWLSAPK
ncbi:MAG: EAL domain-containing protein [Chromatiaceae bacterium]|nr:EAL domain-containing protein [Chromatiaceae bacterium]